jgi:acyl-CoA synthetase (AMP-forming)/AMP-acid ligase II
MISQLRQTIERNAVLYPHASHSICGDRRSTFSHYADRVRRLGSGLQKLGMRHQDRVAMLAMNCMEYLELYGVAETTGYIIATVNWRLAAPEIAYVLNDSAPRVLVFESQYTATIEALRSDLPSIEAYVCIGDNAPSWAIPFETVMATGDAAGASDHANADDILCLVYTSGTTGRPKGCMLTHRNHTVMADQSAAFQGMQVADRALVIAPLFHIGARSQQLPIQRVGGSVVVLRSFDPVEVFKIIEQEKISHVHMVPAMVQGVLDLPDNQTWDVSSLKCIIYAAAPMPVPLLKRALARFGPILINGWGLTEGGNGTMLPQSAHRPDGSPSELKRLGSVGQPALGTEVQVMDDGDHALPSGEVGELCLRSASNMLGYWNNHPASMEALRGGWLRTGDVGYMDEEGYVFLVDRKKDMIISGGENIYCREVEDALFEHPAVADVAVIGVPDEKWGEAVKAVVVRGKTDDAATLSAEQLIAHCRLRIAGYKCPKSVEFVDVLPRLPSGKISKVLLRERFR